eukprot:988501-Heterocapsa_arctica.AAC.1
MKGAGKCLPRPRALTRLQAGESGALANPTRRGGVMTKSPAVSVEPPRENALHGVNGRRAPKGDHARGVAALASRAKYASQHLMKVADAVERERSTLRSVDGGGDNGTSHGAGLGGE